MEKSVFLQPNYSSRKYILISSFNALFAFAVLLAFSRIRDVDMMIATPYTLITYSLFCIAVYGFFTSAATKLIDERRYLIIAGGIIAACLFFAVLNILAFANVFPDRFPIDGYSRILYPQICFGSGALLLYIFAGAISE